MALKLSIETIYAINVILDSFDKELVFAPSEHVLSHWGCSGNCNMTAKGGCGKYH